VSNCSLTALAAKRLHLKTLQQTFITTQQSATSLLLVRQQSSAESGMRTCKSAADAIVCT
jgi:hypothetical protein